MSSKSKKAEKAAAQSKPDQENKIESTAEVNDKTVADNQGAGQESKTDQEITGDGTGTALPEVTEENKDNVKSSDSDNGDNDSGDSAETGEDSEVLTEQEKADQALIDKAIGDLCIAFRADDFEIDELASGDEAIIVLIDRVENKEIARGTLTELQAQAEALSQAPDAETQDENPSTSEEDEPKEVEITFTGEIASLHDREYIEAVFAEIIAASGAKKYDILFEPQDEPIIYGLIAEDDSVLVQGTFEDFDRNLKRAKLALMIPQPIEPEAMKIRYRRFSRKMPLRAIREFEYNGVTYQPGEIFDYASLGLKPYQINGLYNRKVVRHVQQDSRVAYPFRVPPIIVERKEKEKAEAPVINSGHSNEPVNEIADREAKAAADKAEREARAQGKNFTRA